MNNLSEIRRKLYSEVNPTLLPTQAMNVDYRKAGWVDSLGFLRFILGLESFYNIQFSDEELESNEIKTISGLADIIQRKITCSS